MRLFVFILFIFICINTGLAQNPYSINPFIPEKSTLFDGDIYIDNQPSQDQRQLAVCSAFNGWLFAAYTYQVNNRPWISILKSVDKGKTWKVVHSEVSGWAGEYFSKTDLIACGNDTINLKLFFAFIHVHSGNYRLAYVSRFNCSTNQWEQSILGESATFVSDIALATDNLFPAVNSNPYSIAVVYTYDLMYPTYRDTLIFKSSSNGGTSFDNKIGVTGSANHLGKVSIAYGRSSTYNTGRYFIAWEEKANTTSALGHIYTAHTEPDFNSPFTTPHLLDSDPSLNNQVRDPVIACQFSGTDNDSTGLTEVILCERFITSQQRYNVSGFYNKTAAASNNFNLLSLSSGQNNNLQPDISFNPYDLTFMATYFDSTNQKLPYLINNYNLQNPDTWNILSPAYNDSANLNFPNPKIRLDPGEQKGFNAWIAQRSNGNGAAMFDAPFNYPVGIAVSENNTELRIMNIYPNPATSLVFIDLYIREKKDISLKIYNSAGQLAGNPVSHNFPAGGNQVIMNLDEYPSGIYEIVMTGGQSVVSKKILISR